LWSSPCRRWPRPTTSSSGSTAAAADHHRGVWQGSREDPVALVKASIKAEDGFEIPPT
jgi:hypothetical protein